MKILTNTNENAIAGWWALLCVWPFPALGTGDKALCRQGFSYSYSL